MGGQACAVATSLTAQGKQTFAALPVSAKIIRQQIDAILELGEIDAVKLGMIPSRLLLNEIVLGLNSVKAPWIIDPVILSSKGEKLSTLRPDDFIRLGHSSRTITPNLEELGWLTGTPTGLKGSPVQRHSAEMLLDHGFGAVVVKGGHPPEKASDELYLPGHLQVFSSPKLPRSAQVRGTGCRFASALAVRLGEKKTHPIAVRDAKAYVRRYIQRAEEVLR